jgi:hypothetical protein
MEARIQEMEKQKQSTQEEEVEENHNLRDRIKELEEKLTNNLALSSLENKLDIKPIKEEMNKLIELDHEHNKIALNLIIFGIKEQQDENMLAIVKEELKNKSQIETKNKDTIKNIIKSKFKEKMWCDKELEEKKN